MTDSLFKPDYPSIRESANQASLSAQRTFLRLNRALLILLTTTAFASGLGFKTPEYQRATAWMVCGIMFINLALVTSLRIGKFDDRWFRCRAFAETFKSTVWRYIMSPNGVDDESDLQFIDATKQLSERLPDLQKEFARFNISGDLITDWMRSAHCLSIEEKTSLYRKLRVQDQIEWYSVKSKFNCREERYWFWAIFIVQFVAFAFSIFQASQLPAFHPVGGVAAIGTALIAWSQIKRFSDLGTSYAIATGDLQRISATHRKVETQSELNLMVQEVETAVSREHSMWLARRTLG